MNQNANNVSTLVKPGEDVASFAAGFDRLVGLGPQEIQVGMLKRLRGVPIVRHDAEFQMVYSPNPPYEILQTGAIDFATMQRLRRFADIGIWSPTAGIFWRRRRGYGGGVALRAIFALQRLAV